ncbi:hypothetical protein J9253_13115 [Thiothrix litoralis]|uniref:Calx-beta domain-containing protein n=1 Tax=Thiothrix litoralis TaxID=2891210 RepID=A0ABX7WNF0_9GAMM|nr:Calx-beta domain-containing protein [Thiothrix litoralis]QTR44950.1 hypothetical protein J9253_13115 [Thiothrix litoralis]
MAAIDYFNQVQDIYIAYYGRPADPEGLAYWAARLDGANGNLNEIISAFGNSDEATALYGSESVASRIDKIYMQLFGRPAEAEGLAFYEGEIAAGRKTTESAMLDILNGAQNDDLAVLQNKQAVASAFTAHLNETRESNAYAGNAAANTVRDFMSDVRKDNLKDKQLNIDPVIETLVGGNPAPTPTSVSLTTGTDVLSGTLFEAGVGYTPGGNDRVNTLQDEDFLTGMGGNATLNVTLGTPNDNGTNIVTPQLHNMRTVNVDFTSGTQPMELNLQDAPGVEFVHINRITGANNSATIGDMRSIPLNMSLNNTTAQTNTVTFDFAAHTLDRVSSASSDGDVSAITINNADVNHLVIGEVDKQLNALEALKIDSAGNQTPNVIGELNVHGLEQLVVSGSSNLTIGDLTGMDTSLRSLDLREMTGTLTLSDKAVNLIKVDEDSLNAGQKVDGQDAGSDVLEIFNTADVSPADLAGFKNIDKIVFSSGDQTEQQVLTLKLNDAILDGFDTAGTASVATPEIVKLALGAGTADKKVVLDLTDVTTPGKFLFEVSAADLVKFQLIDPNGVFPGVVTPVSNPTFSIANASVAEEAGSVTLTISRDITTDAATVDVQTANGTAIAGQDYTSVTQTVSFAAGAATATVVIPVLDDALPESAETFTLALSNPSMGTIGAAGTATVTITDTDVAGPVARTVTVTNGIDDAAAGSNTTENAAIDDVTFVIADGIGADFTYTIDGFGAGDKIDFEDGFIVPASITNVDFADGLVQISAADASGNIATIVLTGVAAENGSTFIVDATTFNNTFGAGSLI